MRRIQERISYIEGFAEGLDLHNKKEGKLFDEFISILSELNQELEHTSNRLSELEEYVEAIDEDLNEIEWDYYEEDYDDDEEIEEVTEFDLEEDGEGENNLNFFQLECPSCHEDIMIDQDLLANEDAEEIVCPSCQQMLIIDNEDFKLQEENQV